MMVGPAWTAGGGAEVEEDDAMVSVGGVRPYESGAEEGEGEGTVSSQRPTTA